MEPELFQRLGIAALGSRLRRLSEMITNDAAEIYRMQGLDFEPRWFPVFYMLDAVGPLCVSDLAQRIGQSHAAVSQTAKAMKKKGLLGQTRDEDDGRRQLLALSDAGKEIADKMAGQLEDVEAAVRQLLGESQHDLWQAIRDTEAGLARRNLYNRTRDQYKKREAGVVHVVDYESQYRQAFSDLNREWIKKYFVMEEADERALGDPEGYIIDKGGYILVALYKNQPLGVVGLIKMEGEKSYELAKMAVSPLAQGKGIGYRLGQACIEKAEAIGAKRLYLESNTILTPAINLYRKLGFEEIKGSLPSPYARSNIQMELFL